MIQIQPRSNAGTKWITLDNCATIRNDETEPATTREYTDVCEAEPALPAPPSVPVLTPHGMLLVGLLAVVA